MRCAGAIFFTMSQWQKLGCISQHFWWKFIRIHRTQHQSWHCQCLQAELAWMQNEQVVQRSCHHLWVCGQCLSHQWCINDGNVSVCETIFPRFLASAAMSVLRIEPSLFAVTMAKVQVDVLELLWLAEPCTWLWQSSGLLSGFKVICCPWALIPAGVFVILSMVILGSVTSSVHDSLRQGSLSLDVLWMSCIILQFGELSEGHWPCLVGQGLPWTSWPNLFHHGSVDWSRYSLLAPQMHVRQQVWMTEVLVTVYANQVCQLSHVGAFFFRCLVVPLDRSRF